MSGAPESLPALLQRRRGIAPRTTWLVAVALVVVLAVAVLVLRDPYGGRTPYVHRAKPVFNVLITPKVHRGEPRGDELLRLVGRRGGVRAVGTVRPLHLDEYPGDLAGLLPVYADAHARAIAARIPGFRRVKDTKARVHTGPGYWVGFESDAGPGFDILAFPPEVKHPRDGVVLSYRTRRPPGRLARPQRRILRKVKKSLRTFTFGSSRI